MEIEVRVQIKKLLKTTDNYTEFVKDFNNVGYKTYEGESVKLKIQNKPQTGGGITRE